MLECVSGGWARSENKAIFVMATRKKQLGARTLKQWVTAVLSMKGMSDEMSVDGAVQLIHDTPPSRRSSFAEQIWNHRRERTKAMRKNTKKRTVKRAVKRTAKRANPLNSKWKTVKARKLPNGKIQLKVPA